MVSDFLKGLRGDDAKWRLDSALALLSGKRITSFTIDWRVQLSFTDPDAGQWLLIETPFMIGASGVEQVILPGDYGQSIARVIALLGETVTSARTELGMLDPRIVFSNGSRLTLIPDHPAWTGAHGAEWEYWDGHKHWVMY